MSEKEEDKMKQGQQLAGEIEEAKTPQKVLAENKLDTLNDQVINSIVEGQVVPIEEFK